MQKHLFLFLLLSALFQVAVSQTSTNFCGTDMSLEKLPPNYDPYKAAHYHAWRERSANVRYVPLKFHIASLGGGQNATYLSKVQKAVDDANIYYQPSGIQFFICDPDVLVSSDLYYGGNPYAILDSTFVYGYINIYIPYTLSFGCGSASWDRIFLTGVNNCLDGVNLAHEIGHMLHLSHTHEITTGHELVDESNCLVAGDLICDTPADPDLALPGMLDNNCNYIGAVLDSNGQAYHPLTNNIMSYAPNYCVNSFTPEQLNVANFWLDSVKIYLKRYTNLTQLNEFPTSFCRYDSAITLTGTPSGGIFSGTGVIGNMFYPTVAGPGVFTITYNYPGSPDSVESIDQYQYYAFGTPDTLRDAWQSFKSSQDALFTHFTLFMQNDFQDTIQWFVYSGTGTGGILLASGSQIIPITNPVNYVSFYFPTYIPLLTDSIYTFRITTTGSPFILSRSTGIDYYSNYRDGRSSMPDTSLVFWEWVKGYPVCNGTQRYVGVWPPVYGVITSNLFNDYCIDADSTSLQGIPSNGRFKIDGTSVTAIIPSQLGAGIHTLQFITTDGHPCKDTVEKTFTVYDLPIVSITNLPDTVCIGASPITIAVNPSGGTLLIDGLNNSVFSADSLGIGMHTASYSYSNTLDSIDYINQSGYPDTGNYFVTGVIPVLDSVYWQSLKPSATGMVRNLQAYYDPGGLTVSYVIKLYKGVGILGTVLASDTITITPATPNAQGFYTLFDSTFSISMFADSDYSYSFQRLHIYDTTWGCTMFYVYPNPYPRGYCSIDTAFLNNQVNDFSFHLWFEQYQPCTNTIIKNVWVDSCLTTNILNIAENARMSIFPNPANDQIIIRITGFNPETTTIFDIDGRKINEMKFTSVIDITNLSPGIYFIEVLSQNKNAWGKFVKE